MPGVETLDTLDICTLGGNWCNIINTRGTAIETLWHSGVVYVSILHHDRPHWDISSPQTPSLIATKKMVSHGKAQGKTATYRRDVSLFTVSSENWPRRSLDSFFSLALFTIFFSGVERDFFHKMIGAHLLSLPRTGTEQKYRERSATQVWKGRHDVTGHRVGDQPAVYISNAPSQHASESSRNPQ